MGKFYYEFCILKYVLQSYANLKCFGKNFLCYVPCLASHLSIFLIPMKKIYIEMLSWFCCLVLTPVILFPSFSLMSKEAEAERPSKPGGYLQVIYVSKAKSCWNPENLYQWQEACRGGAVPTRESQAWARNTERKEKRIFRGPEQIMHIETSEWWVSFCQAAPEKLQNQSKIGLRQTKEFKRKWEL